MKMPVIRFPDFKKPKLDSEGKYKVKIIATSFRKGKNGTTIMVVTFETLKAGRQITHSWPVYQYKGSLLHQNLRIILQDESLKEVNTDDLLDMKCRIKVYKNVSGYLDVRAIPMKSRQIDETEKF